MIIENISKDEYEKKIQSYQVVFNKPEFCELNKLKVDSIEYLILKKGDSNKFGICFGIINNVAKSPFSAPYSIPIEIKKNLSVDDYDDLFDALDKYAVNKKLNGIQFILPPLFYNEHNISALINSMLRHNYVITNTDLNYSIDLKKYYSDDYIKIIPHKGRSPVRIAAESDLKIKLCETDSDIETAYNIILQNHSEKGYPVKMTYEQVIETLKILSHDVFIVMKNDIPIASAIIYQSKSDVAQVIYWGNLLQYGNLKPMHFLAYQLIQYYGKKGLNQLDIGPSTENSVPNYGLCDFKESIGCTRSLKFTLYKKFSED